jgi:tRNA threonylcarbamoyladenosine biosynthesis protein TsaB
LIPCIKEVITSAGIGAREVQAIGVGLGPGSYTGLRVGVTAAKTLAYVTGAALVGLDSLEAVARNAPGDVLRVSVVADAQRGDVYSAEFTRSSPGGPLECARASAIEPLETWAGRLDAGTLVLGPGLDSATIRERVKPELRATDAGMNYPDGRSLLELLDRELAAGRCENVWLLEPRYMRRSAAEEKWDSQHRS